MGLVLFGSTGLGQLILGGTALLKKRFMCSCCFLTPMQGFLRVMCIQTGPECVKVSAPGLAVVVNVTPLFVTNKHFQL